MKVAFDLSDRAKFRLSGGDAARFLNGQMTNALPESGRVVEACVLNARGKTEGHFFVRREGESFLLDAERALRELLPARLDRYIIADDVLLAEVTEEFALFHLIGLAPPGDHPALSARRLLQEGSDLWVPRGEEDALRAQLAGEAGIKTGREFEEERIKAGLPCWGKELGPEIIPVEANMEERCVSYGKGCYIGQEIISRMKMSGQKNKRLCRLAVGSGTKLSPGEKLWSGEPAREVGWVTSVAADGETGLGFVKRGANETGTKLRAGEKSVEIKE